MINNFISIIIYAKLRKSFFQEAENIRVHVAGSFKAIPPVLFYNFRQ